MLPMTQTQLLRSGNAPLKIFWSAHPTTRIDSHSAAAVLAQCSRWSTLCLTIHCSRADLTWLRQIDGRLAILKKFELNHNFRYDVPDVPNVFAVAPSLREVVVTDSRFMFFSPPVIIPWAQITHYRGTYSTNTQRNILMAASNLLRCALSFESPSEAHDAAISLPHLRSLCVGNSADLLHLNTPSLQELCSLHNSKREIPEILPFLRRSQCSLEKLVLTTCTLSSELIIMLRELSHLTYLLIEFDGDKRSDQSPLFAAMTVSGTDRDICPKLTSLAYGFKGALPLDPFLAMARSRFRSNCSSGCLQRLRIFDARGDCSSGIADSIQLLLDEGFNAAILGRHEADQLKEETFLF
ncbi:hypothetical protein B0H19DRAFT_1152452 [Mycena capillaripes]|nr:hypothetical protein B0H19DRAFT_1152452 [Mycena capillaripes]